MQQIQWTTLKKQYNQSQSKAMLEDASLFLFQKDFGGIKSGEGVGYVTPTTVDACCHLIALAHQHQLSLVVRTGGLSQSGQSLPVKDAITLSMQNFTKVSEIEANTIWAEANASWEQVINQSLQQKLMPPVVPYNTELSVAGVLSAGGVGASSCRYGAIINHIEALEVIDNTGNLKLIDKTDDLFSKILGGQGLFGVITKAKIKLIPAKPLTRTFYFVFQTINEMYDFFRVNQEKIDFCEVFCSPTILGTKIINNKRVPFSSWAYCLQITMLTEEKLPDISVFGSKYDNCVHIQDTDIKEYLLRHKSRFAFMKATQQWELAHPWYECFLPMDLAQQIVPEILPTLPNYFANIVQLAPIANLKQDTFFMLPDAPMISSIMILSPGIHQSLLPSCLDIIKTLDEKLLNLGGKRYLSGYLGEKPLDTMLSCHFDDKYNSFVDSRSPVFSSVLFL